MSIYRGAVSVSGVAPRRIGSSSRSGLDSFERALQTKSETADFRGGVELIYKQLQDALAKLGVKPVAAKGQPFDPHQHEAIEMVETTEVPDHEVIEELQRGYKYKDRLLRPAMVRVAKNS